MKSYLMNLDTEIRFNVRVETHLNSSRTLLDSITAVFTSAHLTLQLSIDSSDHRSTTQLQQTRQQQQRVIFTAKQLRKTQSLEVERRE